MKQVKFGVSGHFLENIWRQWPAIWQADVSIDKILLRASCWLSSVCHVCYVSPCPSDWTCAAKATALRSIDLFDDPHMDSWQMEIDVW